MAIFPALNNHKLSLKSYQSGKDRKQHAPDALYKAINDDSTTVNNLARAEQLAAAQPERRNGLDRRENGRNEQQAIFRRMDPRSKHDRRQRITISY